MRSHAVAIGLSFAWLACSGQTDPADQPQLADCLDVHLCGPGVTVPAPLGSNSSQADAGPGADAGVLEGGIQQQAIPEAGPGPGISGITGAATPPGSSGELGPVCPVSQPTNGAPCDPVVNSVPCAYSVVTCSCVQTWVCF
jgi:hypothetical protein